MPRKGPAPKRPLVNDPVYGSQLVTQLVNKVLMQGKKSLAERIVYDALEQARAVDFQSGLHQCAQGIAGEVRYRAAFLFVMQHLRVLHVRGGKDVGLGAF